MTRPIAFWIGLFCAVTVPIAAAGFSPLLAWRDPIYIVAGFAGITAMVGLLLQTLLASRALPTIHPMTQRKLHRIMGGVLVAAIIAHVGGLWISSPPDVIDALLFASPTSFSLWGVIAMWGIFATAALAVYRRRLRPRTWRHIHKALAVIIVLTTVLHAYLIDGTMETFTKIGLGLVLLFTTYRAVFKQAR
ncbi:ferric reductase-like transmembrane domain-containing protein [Loktanella sp. F6476L]|uniref:ferric reductase-like transmembrane domain-containing protein n=1 Tax=Loktanella sp. F6476L TaxID=2926405 RepID=UPI001FF5DF59|nr:ferric reductase-like transmembrane domain-containing protein [Loktanella sp. F6476L]MCK0120485.1 ferric reductase-like transmembrane domain-containing protein [Loktanella sp. F6476L]